MPGKSDVEQPAGKPEQNTSPAPKENPNIPPELSAVNMSRVLDALGGSQTPKPDLSFQAIAVGEPEVPVRQSIINRDSQDEKKLDPTASANEGPKEKVQHYDPKTGTFFYTDKNKPALDKGPDVATDTKGPVKTSPEPSPAPSSEFVPVEKHKQLAVVPDAKEQPKTDLGAKPNRKLEDLPDVSTDPNKAEVPDKETPLDKLIQARVQARQLLDDARHKYVDAEYGAKGWAKMEGSQGLPEEHLKYTEALQNYKQATMEWMREQLSDPVMQEINPETGKPRADTLVKNTMLEFTNGEFVKKQKEETSIRQERVAAGGYEKYKNKIMNTLEKYRKLSFGKKILISGAVFLSGGGVALLANRFLGGAAAGVGFKEMAEASAAKMREKRNEKSVEAGMKEAKGEDGKIDLDKVSGFLDKQAGTAADKWQKYKTYRGLRTVGAVATAVGLSFFSRALAEKFHNTNFFPTAEASPAAPGVHDVAAQHVDHTPVKHDVIKGDKLWNIIDHKLGDQPGLDDDGRHTRTINALKLQFAHMTPDQLKNDIGISSGNIDQLKVGDKLDLTKVMGDTQGVNDIVKEAASISDAKAEAIASNNDTIKAFFTKHPDIPATSGNIDKVLSGHGDTLTEGNKTMLTPNNEPQSPTPNTHNPEGIKLQPVAEHHGSTAREAINTLTHEQQKAIMVEWFGSQENVDSLARLSDADQLKVMNKLIDFNYEARDYALAGQQVSPEDKTAFSKSMMGKQVDDLLNSQSGDPSEQKFKSRISALVSEAKEKLHAAGEPRAESVKEYEIRVLIKAHEQNIDIAPEHPSVPVDHQEAPQKGNDKIPWQELPRTDERIPLKTVDNTDSRFPIWNTEDSNSVRTAQSNDISRDHGTAEHSETPEDRVRERQEGIVHQAQEKELKYRLQQEIKARRAIEMADIRAKQKLDNFFGHAGDRVVRGFERWAFRGLDNLWRRS